MSTEHQLTPGAAGILGKHPGFGDFIAAGLTEALMRNMGDWAQSVLGQWRETASDGWQAQFDACPRLGFWIGPAITGVGTALRGVWQPSRDRSGRRFPLVVLQAGGAGPLSNPAQDFYAAAGFALDALTQADSFEPRDAAARLTASLPPPQPAPQAEWPVFWAANTRRSLPELLAEVTAADHLHAMTTRSYWWFQAPDQPGAGVLACQGLPGPQELGWLMTSGTPVPETRKQENE